MPVASGWIWLQWSRHLQSEQRLGNVNDWGYIGEAYNDGAINGATGGQATIL
jgi:hypothetical protein